MCDLKCTYCILLWEAELHYYFDAFTLHLKSCWLSKLRSHMNLWHFWHFAKQVAQLKFLSLNWLTFSHFFHKKTLVPTYFKISMWVAWLKLYILSFSLKKNLHYLNNFIEKKSNQDKCEGSSISNLFSFKHFWLDTFLKIKSL